LADGTIWSVTNGRYLVLTGRGYLRDSVLGREHGRRMYVVGRKVGQASEPERRSRFVPDSMRDLSQVDVVIGEHSRNAKAGKTSCERCLAL